MNDPQSGELVQASDGVSLAGVVRPWADEKLHYVREYINIFTTGMKDKWNRRAYVDLFSGPGRCLIKENSREIPGSPVIAAQAKYPFTDLYLNDSDPRAARALQQRLGERTGMEIATLDCNEAAGQARRIFANRGVLGLAFIDPTAFQIKLSAISALTSERPVDLIITFMTGYLRRFLSTPGYDAGRLDDFFGSPDWRDIVSDRALGETITYRRLLDHYETKLRSLNYMHVDDHIRILNSNESTIYHLVFASKHPRGAEFFKKIRRKRYGGQITLFDE